jgi:predicted nucleotidyltransferase
VAEFTRPATWEDVKRLARYLDEAGVEYALIGGYALAAQGLVRATEDVDLLVNPSVDNSRRWIVALSRLPDGAARELEGDPDVFAKQRSYAIRINDEITVDVLPAACGVPWEALRDFIEQVDIDGVPIRILSLEGLLRTKSGARPKDQADAAAIRRALAALGRSSE